MSSHYFVKENQEYCVVFLSADIHDFWLEYLAWQPYIISTENSLDKLALNSVDPDQHWVFDNPAYLEEAAIDTKNFKNLEEALEILFQNHPNNAFLIFSDKPEVVKSVVEDLIVDGKSVEVISGKSRSLLVNHPIKKWFATGIRIQSNSLVKDPDGNELVLKKKDWVIFGERGCLFL